MFRFSDGDLPERVNHNNLNLERLDSRHHHHRTARPKHKSQSSLLLRVEINKAMDWKGR